MKSPRKGFIVTGVMMALATSAVSLHADVKAQEKTLVKFTGVLGKMVGMFGGKAAREGVTSSIALKGDRKARITDNKEQIIDLQEEKVYDIDLEGKSYTVTTFADLRKKMEDARERAKERDDKRAAKDEKNDKGDQPQFDVDVDIKNTGEKKSIAGYDTHEVVMTITVREKGKTLEDGGGVVITADTWLAPQIAEMKELVEFEKRYVQALYGPMMSTQDMQQFAMAMAAHPALKDAMARLQQEKGNLQGTPISTTTTIDGVQSKEQAAQAKKDGDDDKDSSPGGMMGTFAKKFGKKKGDDEDKEAKGSGSAGGAKNRATFMTLNNDVLKIEPSASAADVAVPAGFKLKS